MQLRKITLLLIHFLLITFYFGHSQTTEIKYLSGRGNADMVQWDFYCTGGMNNSKWTKIGVPSCWELQGFGKYDYGFAKDSVRGKEKGLYKYEFTVPAAWKGKQVNIVFEGVMTDAEVKVNGQSAGPIHQGAFYAFKYDISSLLKWGEKNMLEVTVAKHSANESVNDAERRADFWIFGGIFRPVFLEALPKDHIENVAIDAKADGSFTADVSVVGLGVDRVQAQIFSLSNTKVGKPFTAFLKQSQSVAELHQTIVAPKLWNPESPNRYKVVFTLMHGANPIHVIEQKFGFRTVEVRQLNGIYVNGVKVKMKGVNRHSFRPETGRTMSLQNSIEDVLLIKDMNMNAVRMSHYPPDGHFLDVCDSLGLFVMDELAGWHGHYDTETGTKRVKEMLLHDRNHPSIIFWSNGNEGGHNFDLDPLFTEWDIQHRPVVHPWQDFGGFDTQHYREFDYGIGNFEHGHSIVMPTEFLHGWYDGGHGAGLEDYWEKMWHNPTSAGGFLWDFADQGVVRHDLHDSLDTDKHRGADGIMGPHHEKEGSYFAIKEIWSPVVFEKKEITPDWDGKLNVENRYFFTNLKEVEFSWELFNAFDGGREFSTITREVLIQSPDVKPFEKGILKVNLPKDWQMNTAINIIAKRNGKEIFTRSFPIIKPKDFVEDLKKKAGTIPQILTQDSSYQIIVAGVKLSINKNTGLLQSVENGYGRIALANGPIIQQGTTNFKGFTTRFDSSSLIIESTFDKKESYNTLQWTIYPSGIVKMKVRYFPAAYFTDLVGVNFNYSDSQNLTVSYMGYGPYRVWKNRMKGGQFGIWNKTFNNSETGEAPWQYPEFKGYYRNLYWAEFYQAKQKAFTVYTETEDLFLRLFTPVWKTDQWHNYEPIFPSGDISFMQGIPGIGSKTQRNETTGPMGAKNIFYDYEKDPSRALELVLYFDFTGN